MLRAATSRRCNSSPSSSSWLPSSPEPLAPAGDALVGTVTHRFDPTSRLRPAPRAPVKMLVLYLLALSFTATVSLVSPGRPASLASAACLRRTGLVAVGARLGAPVVHRRISPGRIARYDSRSAPIGLVERRERRVQALDGAVAEQRTAATSFLEDIKPDYAAGDGAFGGARSDVGESWYETHATLSGELGRRREGSLITTNCGTL